MARGVRVGNESLLDIDFEGIAIDRSIEDSGVMPLEVIPATKVAVFHWPGVSRPCRTIRQIAATAP